MGDYAYQKPDVPAATPEEAAKREKLSEELAKLRESYGKLAQQLYTNGNKLDQEEKEKLSEELSEVRIKMSDVQAQLPREYETHGWVWLFLRK